MRKELFKKTTMMHMRCAFVRSWGGSLTDTNINVRATDRRASCLAKQRPASGTPTLIAATLLMRTVSLVWTMLSMSSCVRVVVASRRELCVSLVNTTITVVEKARSSVI